VSVGDDFVQYLTELGIGTPGINLWLGGSPGPGGRDHHRRDRRPPLRITTMGPGEVIDRPSVQILVRNPAYLLARDKADQIRDAFDGLANWPINGTRYLSVTAMSDPAYLGKAATSQGETHRVQPELRHDARAGGTGHRPVRRLL